MTTCGNSIFSRGYRGEVSSDEASNCELSQFQAGCLEIELQSGSQNPVDETSASDRAALLEGPHTHVGIGYFEDYWVILAGNMEGAPVGLPADPVAEMPAMEPEEEVMVESTTEPAPEMEEEEKENGGGSGSSGGGSVRNFLDHYFSQA